MNRPLLNCRIKVKIRNGVTGLNLFLVKSDQHLCFVSMLQGQSVWKTSRKSKKKSEDFCTACHKIACVCDWEMASKLFFVHCEKKSRRRSEEWWCVVFFFRYKIQFENSTKWSNPDHFSHFETFIGKSREFVSDSSGELKCIFNRDNCRRPRRSSQFWKKLRKNVPLKQLLFYKTS